MSYRCDHRYDEVVCVWEEHDKGPMVGCVSRARSHRSPMCEAAFDTLRSCLPLLHPIRGYRTSLALSVLFFIYFIYCLYYDLADSAVKREPHTTLGHSRCISGLHRACTHLILATRIIASSTLFGSLDSFWQYTKAQSSTEPQITGFRATHERRYSHSTSTGRCVTPTYPAATVTRGHFISELCVMQ